MNGVRAGACLGPLKEWKLARVAGGSALGRSVSREKNMLLLGFRQV